jgi:DNA polymerase I-like protein with 3'-5' exonuclease and polymerase domains
VQSFATAEIIPVGLVYFWHAAKAANLELMVVNSIHDSIICEVPPNEVEAFHALSKYALIEVPYWYLGLMYGVSFTAPLGAGVSVGPNWADEQSKKSEQTYNAAPAMYLHGG